MSYARFGEQGSQVYLYLLGEGIHCCGCALGTGPDGHCPDFATAKAAAEHLRGHQEAGHTVPAGVVEQVLANAQLCPAQDRADRFRCDCPDGECLPTCNPCIAVKG